MDQLRGLLHLGDFELILPAATAIAVGLAVARAYRLAAWWSVLFIVAAGMVGVSKIAYLSWGGGLPALAFKSFSGHATGAMAVYPMLCYLMLPDPHWRRVGMAAGVAGAAGLALLLVLFKEHSVAEAVSGCLLGLMACGGSLVLAGASRSHASPTDPAEAALGADPVLRRRALAAAAIMFAALASLMSSAHVGWWMIKAARAVSGQQQLHPLSLE